MTETALPARVAAVLFDMDNTLVRSEQAWIDAAEQLWGEAWRPDEVELELGCSLADVLDAYAKDFPAEPREDAEARYRDLLSGYLAKGVPTMPGAEELLDKLAAANIPVTIASNSPAAIVRQVVDSLGWGHRFTAALGADEVPNPKPAPDLYLRAAQAAGVSIVDCVVFEDSPMGTTAARDAGAFVVSVGPDSVGLGDQHIDSLADQEVHSWQPLPITQ